MCWQNQSPAPILLEICTFTVIFDCSGARVLFHPVPETGYVLAQDPVPSGRYPYTISEKPVTRVILHA
jgi:hypothetical protein